MGSGIILIWAGALLILCGVLYGVAQVLWKGRLSDPKRAGTVRAAASLEPQQDMRPFSLKDHWPAFGLIAAGALLILIVSLRSG